MSLQTKNIIFLVCSDIIKNLNEAYFLTFLSHNVDNPVWKGLCKFQANKVVNSRVTVVNSKFKKSQNNFIAAAMMVGKRMSTSLL